MIRVGVVGLGVMGQHHARLYSQLNCKFVGVADNNAERAKEIGEQYNVKYYTDYHDLLSEIDAVSIAVPTTLHHPIAMAFLQKGVNCLVEKPIASDLSQADEMIIEAERNGANLAVGHIEMFNPAVAKLKHILESHMLGELLTIYTRRVGPFVPRILDVGVIIDSAIHDIGVVRYLADGEPISVFSRLGRFKHIKEDYATIILDFVRTIASIEVNWFTPHKVRTLVATGSEGIAYLDYMRQEVKLHNSHDMEVIEIQKQEPLKLELEDFLRSVVEGKKPQVDGIEGLKTLKIAIESCIDNCYTSRKTLTRAEDMTLERASLGTSSFSL